MRIVEQLGIAFDNYDATGLWRTVEAIEEGTGTDPQLDPRGTLSDLDKVAAAVTEKLATYALRRGMTFSDREELKHIVDKAKSEHYRLTSLIESLVTSPLFVKR